jgi:hypothetical protein
MVFGSLREHRFLVNTPTIIIEMKIPCPLRSHNYMPRTLPDSLPPSSSQQQPYVVLHTTLGAPAASKAHSSSSCQSMLQHHRKPKPLFKSFHMLSFLLFCSWDSILPSRAILADRNECRKKGEHRIIKMCSIIAAKTRGEQTQFHIFG